jgi:hypothetical protein
MVLVEIYNWLLRSHGGLVQVHGVERSSCNPDPDEPLGYTGVNYLDNEQ